MTRVVLALVILKVIAFSDEEGVRFQSTFLGSAAIAGVLPVSTLQIPDKRYSDLLSYIRFMTTDEAYRNFVKQWFDSAKCFEGELDRHYRRKP